MHLISPESITVLERQRKTFEQPEIDQLKRSIMSKGLMHPIVLTSAHQLVAGERRLRAMLQLYEEGLTFNCNGDAVGADLIPFTFVNDLTPADLEEAELEENILRVPLSMLEEVQAKAKIHQLRCEQNPKQRIMDTAREIAAITGSAAKNENVALVQSLTIAQHLDDPRVQRAASRSEAYRAILDKRETLFRAQLAKAGATLNLEHKIIHGDCLVELPKLPSNSVATIFCDPPYGIKADKQGKESNHYYDDSPDNALKICEAIIREGFRITKSRAVLFMFCDIDHFLTLRTYAAQQAWTPFRTPLIWSKGRQGHAPWGRAGARRTYEVCLFAVKGQAELVKMLESDVLPFDNVSRTQRVHAAEKPYELYAYLLAHSTLPGETVLDPCAGSGPIIPAASKCSLRSICIERDETSYAECLARLSGGIPNPSEDAAPDAEKSDLASLIDLATTDLKLK